MEADAWRYKRGAGSALCCGVVSNAVRSEILWMVSILPSRLTSTIFLGESEYTSYQYQFAPIVSFIAMGKEIPRFTCCVCGFSILLIKASILIVAMSTSLRTSFFRRRGDVTALVTYQTTSRARILITEADKVLSGQMRISG